MAPPARPARWPRPPEIPSPRGVRDSMRVSAHFCRCRPNFPSFVDRSNQIDAVGNSTLGVRVFDASKLLSAIRRGRLISSVVVHH